MGMDQLAADVLKALGESYAAFAPMCKSVHVAQFMKANPENHSGWGCLNIAESRVPAQAMLSADHRDLGQPIRLRQGTVFNISTWLSFHAPVLEICSEFVVLSPLISRSLKTHVDTGTCPHSLRVTQLLTKIYDSLRPHRSPG